MKVKAILASDIDHTLTDSTHKIPPEVIKSLKQRYDNGWKIVFVTGRTFVFANQALRDIPFPFEVAVMHGAETIDMPSQTILDLRYLTTEILNVVDGIYKDHDEYFLVYSGKDKGDYCYFVPKRHSQGVLDYFSRIQTFYGNSWVALDGIRDVHQDSFPLLRCFGDLETMQLIQRKLHALYPEIHTELIDDAIEKHFKLLMITHPDAQKGKSLQRIIQRNGWEGPVIAAGDDENDITLFDVADVKIAISRERGSEKLKRMADIIGKPSSEMGILASLIEAEKRLKI